MNITPELCMDKLAARFGAGEAHRFSNAVRSRVNMWKTRLNRLMEPVLTYRIVDIPYRTKSMLELERGVRLKSVKLARALRDSRKAVCFLVTIGPGIEEEINRLMEDKHLSEAYILDALGSVAVEDMAEQFQRRMESRHFEKGLVSTLRFSPGYCDWDIGQQTMIFRALNGRSAGIRLTDSCLMVPRKSVSGIIGMSAHGEDLEAWSPCRTCKQRNCPGRR